MLTQTQLKLSQVMLALILSALAIVFAADARAQILSQAPSILPEEDARVYHACDEHHKPYAIIHNMSGGRKATDAACLIKFADAESGAEYGGCWIYKTDFAFSRRSRRSYFASRGVREDAPLCREVFGDPVEFPSGGGKDAVYALNCGAIGRETAPDLQSCECPPELPHAEGIECLKCAPGRERPYGPDGPFASGWEDCIGDAEAARAAERESQGVPRELAEERVREYLACKQHHEVIENLTAAASERGGRTWDFNALDAACKIKFMDAKTGERKEGCWIQTGGRLTWPGRARNFHSRYKIMDENPTCREVFGEPVEFPAGGGRDAVYMLNCESIDRVASSDGRSCECPAERPHLEGDACVTVAEKERAERAAERRAAGVPDELREEFVREYIDCKENHRIVEHRIRSYDFSGGGRREYHEVDAACRIKFTDARTGRQWGGCWIQNRGAYTWHARRAHFPRHGIDEESPHCREVFGEPVVFPVGGGGDAVYMLNCESIDRVVSDDLESCECPAGKPNEYVYRGEAKCIGDDAEFVLSACAGNGWKIQPMGGNKLACVVELE